MKITYYLIDQMAKSNQGTTSSIPAIDYFEATINNPKSKIREDKRQLKKLREFVANIDSFKDKNGDLILTKEEINALMQLDPYLITIREMLMKLIRIKTEMLLL